MRAQSWIYLRYQAEDDAWSASVCAPITPKDFAIRTVSEKELRMWEEREEDVEEGSGEDKEQRTADCAMMDANVLGQRRRHELLRQLRRP